MGSNGGVMIKSVLYKFHKQLCVNNIKVTVNTCTCTDVFTTKDFLAGRPPFRLKGLFTN